jgi:hypothetical protein
VGLMAAAARSLRQPKAHQRHASPVPADVPTSNHLHSPPLSGTFTTAAATINSQTLCFLLDVGCRRNYSLSALSQSDTSLELAIRREHGWVPCAQRVIIDASGARSLGN